MPEHSMQTRTPRFRLAQSGLGLSQSTHLARDKLIVKLHSVNDFRDLVCSVADPDPCDTDPDPAVHFDTDPDPAFQFDTNPDLSV